MPDWFWYVVSPVAVLGYLVFYFGARRRSALAVSAGARGRGWDYQLRNRSLSDRYSGWPFTGVGRRVRNVVTGSHRERPFAAYEFTFRVGMDFKYADDGLLRNRCRYQVVSVSHGLEGVPVTEVDGKEGSIASVVKSMVGRLDPAGSDLIERMSATLARRPDGDPDGASRDARSRLQARAHASNVRLRFENGDAVTWRSGPLDLDEVEELLGQLNDVVDALAEDWSGQER